MKRLENGKPGGRPWTELRPKDDGPAARDVGLARRLKSRVLRLAPRPIVALLARPYIAGESREEAIALSRRLHHERGLHTTLDLLGEAVTDPAETRTMLDEYLRVLDDLGRCPHSNVSIKLSALGQALDRDLCARNLERLLTAASRYDQFVRFDMEDHTTTSSTLSFYREFVGRYPRIGVVLQSRLHRTEQDVQDLAPLKPNVRLCLGIYREPPDIALQDKPAMKERLLRLLEMMWDNGQYVALATHDERVIERSLDLAGRMGVTPRSFEVQMLLGVPRAGIQRKLIDDGIIVRLYAPYGKQWYHYCLRRLENNPEMARMVLGNLLRFRP